MAYPSATKLEALLLLRQGVGVRDVARRLGVSPGTIINWRDRRHPLTTATAPATRRASEPSRTPAASPPAHTPARHPEPPAAPPPPPVPAGGWRVLPSSQVVWDRRAS